MPPSYFEQLYAGDPDPWGFATSAYERHKYGTTLEALPRERYRRALEVGCSIGVLTAQLAPRCAELVALDVAEQALEQARRRCATLPQVEFRRASFPGEAPAGRFDLILLSEVVYYLDRADIARAGRWIENGLAPGGDLLLVHWTGPTDYPLSGDTASELVLEAVAGFTRPVLGRRHDRYRLDLVRRPPPAGPGAGLPP
ncbi:class I SAM-dependent DNA methyltransferase [Marinimicrococcus flavescens]|uniref:SAM-dependent methyltransferase n=1 Tax=Marinimicrococcus flavescens TaxID=3031815 RepID=A0AAP4D5D5_9PROT|nr:SAM-dependent methyltransferase [Marinimicrococcus flavescens]